MKHPLFLYYITKESSLLMLSATMLLYLDIGIIFLFA
jgi:hypothetical protein